MEATTTRRPIRADRTALPAAALSAARALLAGAVVIAAVLAGTGFLYLIRGWAPPAAGPWIPGALPLQQLAGGESQPLLSLAVAWVPAGFVAGLALTGLTRFRPAVRVAVAAALAAALLLLAGAAADAIAVTEPVGPHLAPQLGRPGTWVAVALFAIGASFADRRAQ